MGGNAIWAKKWATCVLEGHVFCEYLNVFMKLFLDDFIIFIDMITQLSKLWLCFEKCQEDNISLNLKECMFLVFSGMILGFIVSREGKLLDPKKIKVFVNMSAPTISHEIYVFNGIVQFYCYFIQTSFSLWH